MEHHVPGLAEVSDELYSDSAVSVRVAEDREREVLETSLAHVAVRLEEYGKTVAEHAKEVVPLLEAQGLS
jgi:hypothetical protein